MHRYLGLALGVSVGLATSSVAAQTVGISYEDEAKEDLSSQSGRRTVGGHLFVQSNSVMTPFTSTYAQFSVGGGLANGDAPVVNVDGTLGRDVSHEVAGVTQSATLQWGIFDWWAIRGSVASTVYGGRNRESALAVGGVVQVRGLAGTTLSYQVHPKVRLGALLDVQSVPREIVNVLDPIRDSIEQGQVMDVSLVTSTDTVTVGTGLSAAWAPHESLGFIGTARYLFQDAVTGVDMEEDAIALELQADYDIRSHSRVPIALLAAYKLSQPLDTDIASAAHVIELSGYYTRGSELVLGPGVEIQWFEIRPGADVQSYILDLSLYYYW